MMDRFIRLAENANCRTEQLFEELERLAVTQLDIKLFSVMKVDFAGGEAHRIYTSEPEVYPLSGTKPITTGDWADIVIGQKRLFVANDYAALVEVFPDHEVIKSLGCEAIINVPIVIGGKICGTLNILGPAGAYPPATLPFAEQLKVPSTFCFLFNDYVTNGNING